MRSLWKGTISFGLVTIPVKLYAATEDRQVRFHQLHAECQTPVRYLKWCPHCRREVEAAEIVRGYAYEPDRYVVLSEEDFAGLPAALARTVEILDFVQLADIDPVYFVKTYFLEPGEGGARAYGLLRRALLESGRVGIARVALRGKATLAAIRVVGGRCLTLETMRYPDEVRSFAGLQIPADDAFREQELTMATTLIQMLAGGFVPERYQDEYREAVLARIQEKIAGRQVVHVAAPEPAGRVVDLMEALRASVQQAEAARARAAAPGGPAAPTYAVPGPAGAPPPPPPPH